MARARIFDAAGDTSGFLHDTAPPRMVSDSPTQLVLRGRIVSGPFEDEIATTVLIGRFDLDSGTAEIAEVRQSVGGDLHFTLKLDRPVDLDDPFGAGFSEPIAYRGNRFDNFLEGDRGDDRLLGGGGGDELRGLAGDDRLDGGRGADELAGGAGRDRLFGGRGSDELTGGGGEDTFAFRSEREAHGDTVRGFASDADRIDLRRIDADGATGRDDAFEFIADAAFSGAAGELRFADDRLEGDTDGDGAADFAIAFARGAPTAGDLLL